MNSSGRFSGRDALDPMNTGLDRKGFVGAVTPRVVLTDIDAEDVGVNQFGLKPWLWAKAQIHAGQVVGKNLGLVLRRRSGFR